MTNEEDMSPLNILRTRIRLDVRQHGLCAMRTGHPVVDFLVRNWITEALYELAIELLDTAQEYPQ